MHVRAAIYLRISQDRTGEELGVTRQRKDCKELAERRGWDLVGVYVDNDTSATSGKRREQWELMMTDIEDGEIDVVIGVTIDRTLRTGRDRLRMLELGKSKNLTISLTRGSDMDLSTPAGRFAADILGAVAQNEIEVKSDRQKSATAQAAAMGKWTGGRKPFGFEPDGVTVREDEAQAIRDAYEALIAGATLKSIADQWNELGLRTGQAPRVRTQLGARSPWRSTTVKRVLENSRYAGIRSYQGEECGTAQWPALVPLEVFRAAQDVFRRRQPRGAPRRQLLTGVAVCGNPLCGRTVHACVNSRGDMAYRCSSSDKANTFITPVEGRHPYRRAVPVDEYVTNHVLERLDRRDAWELLTDDEDSSELPALRAEVSALQKRLEQLAAEFATLTDIPLREYRAMTQATRDRLTDVESRLVASGRNRVLSQLIRASDTEAVWEDLAMDRQRVIIDGLMTVTLLPVGAGSRLFRPETVIIEWNG